MSMQPEDTGLAGTTTGGAVASTPGAADGGEQDAGPLVGAADADADAARSGADVTPDDGGRDSDGTPVGLADAEADAARSGADPGVV